LTDNAGTIFKIMKKNITNTFFILFFLGFFLLAHSCRENLEEEFIDKQPVIYPDQIISDAEVIFTQNERVTSILNASRLLIYEEEGLTIADSAFQLDMFNTEGVHSSVLTADSGIVKGEDSLIAIGTVVVVSDSGVVLETERLYWDRMRGGVRSDTSVVLTTETDTLYGDGLIADEGLNNWEIFNPRGKTVRVIKKKNGS